MNWKLIGTTVAFLPVLFLSVAAAGRIRPDQDAPAQSGSPGGQASGTSTEHRVVVQNEIEVRCSISLEANVTSSSGAAVRPVAISCIFVAGQTLLASQHGLILVPTEGSEANSNSIHGLDLRLVNPQLEESAAVRSYRVDIAPRSGLSWGNVASARTDLTVSASRID